MVDKHIRRLDTDLRKFEAELESATSTTPTSSSSLSSSSSAQGTFSPPPTSKNFFYRYPSILMTMMYLRKREKQLPRL